MSTFIKIFASNLELFSPQLTDDNLYEQILFGFLNNRGPHKPNFNDSNTIELLKCAINIGEEKHDEMLEKAKARDRPQFKLNIELVEFNGVNSMQLDEPLSPFMRIYVFDLDGKQLNEVEKIEQNHFSVQSDTFSNDTIKLTLEIRKKKGCKCFKFLDKLIGNVIVELNIFSAFEDIREYTLKKNERHKGTIKVKINYNSDLQKDKRVAFQEHCYLVKHLVLDELKKPKKDNKTVWEGNFQTNIRDLISQHQAQNYLTVFDIALIQWIVYTEIHHQGHKIALEAFTEIVNVLKVNIQNNNVSCDESEMFWKWTCLLLPSCLDIIRNLRGNGGNVDAFEQLKSALSLLSKLAEFEAPQDLEMFPREYYEWLRKTDKMNIQSAVEQTIIAAANDNFDVFADGEALKSSNPCEKVTHCIEVVETIKSEIERLTSETNELFKT